eukprot:gnl/Spiro4/7265_TR3801_c0_g1_i1.p1 gnl/Spiro4/7265_TR3801_c0_g1~~gnl/Spiro4/7265_TR3801_c0_g1_i1.p1  ORF type:complete len:466 (-),score=81.05 gnl/Spiro4/7265_TR3801_c0_g1_i1:53-1450(-)
MSPLAWLLVVGCVFAGLVEGRSTVDPLLLMPRRTFPMTVHAPVTQPLSRKERLVMRSQPVWIFPAQFNLDTFMRDYYLVPTIREKDFCAAMFPTGYLTEELLELRRNPTHETLRAMEGDLPPLGHWSFGRNVSTFDLAQLNGPEFRPDRSVTYLFNNAIACSARVLEHMERLYALPGLSVVSLQLSRLSCSMASFDMLFYAYTWKAGKLKGNPGRWTGRLNVGGVSHYGGRTTETQLNDFRNFGLVPFLVSMKPATPPDPGERCELTAAQAHELQGYIDEYGPAAVSLSRLGHIVVLDGFHFDDNLLPVAMFVRDPMNALAYAIPWRSAQSLLSQDFKFVRGKRPPTEFVALEDEDTLLSSANQKKQIQTITEEPKNQDEVFQKQEDDHEDVMLLKQKIEEPKIQDEVFQKLEDEESDVTLLKKKTKEPKTQDYQKLEDEQEGVTLLKKKEKKKNRFSRLKFWKI